VCRLPSRALTALREMVTVVFASAIALALALGAFAILRTVIPRHTPDAGLIARSGTKYTQDHLSYVLAWSVGLFIAACLLALALAALDAAGRLATLLRPKDGVIFESAWWTLFEFKEADDRYKVVTCHLTDGTVLRGTLYTF